MSADSKEFDVRSLILYPSAFGPKEILLLRKHIGKSVAFFNELVADVNELKSKDESELSPATYVKLGVCLYLVGKYDEAEEALKKGDGGALVHFYFAKLQFVKQDYDATVHEYDYAQKAGYGAEFCALGRAEAYRAAGRIDKSLQELDALSGPVEHTAEYLYQRAATVGASGENPKETVALYERAYQADPNHQGTLFGLALENDRRGNDRDALRFYEAAVATFPPRIGALINLGVLYEDYGLYEKAIDCYERVLKNSPNDRRAAMFLKDAKASLNSLVVQPEPLFEKRKLEQSILEFDLTQRSKKCLETLGVKTIGDLCAHSEHELMKLPNFGEVSLREIKGLLESQGLALGAAGKKKEDEEEIANLPPDIRDRSISDLELSVRARKCMARADVKTLGDLVKKSAAQLMECKNFGVTSLNEIREKLAKLNLSLKGE